jgi:hypothetical protein
MFSLFNVFNFDPQSERRSCPMAALDRKREKWGGNDPLSANNV